MCHVASDWYEFAEKVTAQLDPVHGMLSAGERRIIKDVLEPGAVYKELDDWLTGSDQPAAA